MFRRRGINGNLHVHQGILEDTLNSLFSSPHVIKEARKEVCIKHPLTGQYLEVDVWYPDLNVCFEYQDDHHYQPTWYQQKPLDVILEHDNFKRSLLLQRRETLILVPCWWDGSPTSLQATINFSRPDLLHSPSVTDVIPANPPFNFFLEDAQLMLASFPYSVDLVEVNEHSQWWLGEKYDGVRCFWNPNEQQMYSRHGLTIDMYSSINNLFGHITLDGEIWCGRGLYLETNFMIHSSLEKPNWALFRVVCFDEASQCMTAQPFEQRYNLILSHYHPEHPTTIIAPRFLCKSNLVLTSALQQVVDEGGEGIILRRPQSRYQPGRSTDLIKLKGSRGDREAVVVGVGDDGSLELQLSGGTNFTVPRTDCILHRRARVGDVVSFTHNFAQHATQTQNDAADTHEAYGHAETQDALRTHASTSNPIVYRIREDMTQRDITTDLSQIGEYYTRKPNRDWDYDQSRFVRGRLEVLAREKGFDPLVTFNWYGAPHYELSQDLVVRRFMSTHSKGNSWAKVVAGLFPELNLDISKFASSFNNLQKEREVFERFAREKGGDPVDPRFWYSLGVSELSNDMKTAMFYKRGYRESVMHLFPELHLVKSEFKPQKVKMWKNQKETREFFDNFAAAQGFDPLVPTNWYTASLNHHEEYNNVLDGDKLSDVLMWLYPDIGLQQFRFNDYKVVEMLKRFARSQGGDPHDPHFWYSLDSNEFKNINGLKRFTRYERYMKLIVYFFPQLHLKKSKFKHSVAYWKDPENRKKAFLRFATVHSFDPLVPSHWYQTSHSDLHSFEETRGMLRHYGGKYIGALMDAFPHLLLDSSKFTRVPVGYWQKLSNRRLVFLEIAQKGRFDPLVLANWYNISRSLKRDQSVGYKILKQFYNGNIVEGLKDMFPDMKVAKRGEIKLSSFHTKMKS